MLEAALRRGTAHRRCVFELFARRLPRRPPLRRGRRHRPVARGARRSSASRTTSSSRCADAGRRRRDRCDWLAGYRFTGRRLGLRARASASSRAPRCSSSRAPSPRRCCSRPWPCRSSTTTARSPSAAARMAAAAGGRPCIEMGSRRTHEQAAVAAARAAYVAGFAATSQPRGRAGATASRPSGTAAHAFTLLHDDERDGLRGPGRGLGTGTTLLVDTYDVDGRRPDRRRGRRHRARRRADRLRRPAEQAHAGPRASSTSSAPPARGSS